MSIETAVLTISTRGSRGERGTDTSGMIIKEMVAQIDCTVVEYAIIPDDEETIVAQLRYLAEKVQAALVLTTGGTGISATDVTPEATLAVIERRLPGFEEAMRAAGFNKTPYAILSRGVCGTCKKSLIINLPGNPKGVRENLEAVLQVIPHAIRVLQNETVADGDHGFPGPTD